MLVLTSASVMASTNASGLGCVAMADTNNPDDVIAFAVVGPMAASLTLSQAGIAPYAPGRLGFHIMACGVNGGSWPEGRWSMDSGDLVASRFKIPCSHLECRKAAMHRRRAEEDEPGQ